MQILTYLNQAYPFYYEKLKRVFLFLCFISTASFLFTYLFEPFVVNVDEHKIDSLWIMVLHSVIPMPIAFMYLFFLKNSVKSIENWTIGKEFRHLAIILVLTGLASFLVRDFIYTNPDNWSFRYLWEELRNTFLVGCLLLTIILPLNRERLNNKHLKELKKLPALMPDVRDSKTIIDIITPIAGESFVLNLQFFLYAKVDGNYLEIFYHSSSKKEKELKRLTLKEFNSQLISYPFIFKVHRSYVVNLNAITSISGNAQGYTLHLKDHSLQTVPVSRSKIKEFNKLYTHLKSQ